MAGNLAQLIADAVRAATSDYAPDPVNPAASGAIGARPPLALSQLKIEFELTYDKNGKLGLKKEWTGPLGVTAEASAETKRTNKLEIVYSKAD